MRKKRDKRMSDVKNGELEEGKELWRRRPDESAKAFSEFMDYLELGPDATLEEMAAKLGKSPEAVWKMSSRHHWMKRRHRCMTSAESWRELRRLAGLQRAKRQRKRSIRAREAGRCGQGSWRR